MQEWDTREAYNSPPARNHQDDERPCNDRSGKITLNSSMRWLPMRFRGLALRLPSVRRPRASATVANGVGCQDLRFLIFRTYGLSTSMFGDDSSIGREIRVIAPLKYALA